MILWLHAGALIGFVLGLTGAGGAVISAPLFIFLFGLGFKEAVAVSTLIVAIAGLANWYVQRESSNWKLAILIVLTSLAVSPIFIGLKSGVPLWFSKAFYLFVCALGIYGLWFSDKFKNFVKFGNSNTILPAAATGFFLSGLTTFAGIGSGVVLVPWLSGAMGLSLKGAISTSLLVISITAIPALFYQSSSLTNAVNSTSISLLILGGLFSSVVTRILLEIFPEGLLNATRRIALSLAIGFSAYVLLKF